MIRVFFFNFSIQHLKAQISDLVFRIQFLNQLQQGTGVNLIDHWNKALWSPKHYECYKLAVVFLDYLRNCIDYSIKTKIAMDRAIWEHQMAITLHQQILDGRELKNTKEEMRMVIERIRHYRHLAEIMAPKAERYFDLVDVNLVNLTVLTFRCQREDEKKAMGLRKLNRSDIVTESYDSGRGTLSRCQSSTTSKISPERTFIPVFEITPEKDEPREGTPKEPETDLMLFEDTPEKPENAPLKSNLEKTENSSLVSTPMKTESALIPVEKSPKRTEIALMYIDNTPEGLDKTDDTIIPDDDHDLITFSFSDDTDDSPDTERYQG